MGALKELAHTNLAKKQIGMIFYFRDKKSFEIQLALERHHTSTRTKTWVTCSNSQLACM